MRELILTFLQLFVAWRGLLSFLVCLAMSFFLVTLEKQEKLVVVQSLTSTVLYPVQLIVAKFQNHSDLAAENQRLALDNARLRQMVDKRYQESLENIRLRAMLGVPVQSEFPVSVGLVLARDVGAQGASCTISLGSTDSIQAGMPVYTVRGLVGQVQRVDAASAEVQLLNAPYSRVSVMDNRSRVAGILESSDGIVLHMSVPHNSDLKAGDEIVTSGLGGIFPKGMPVGRVLGFRPNQMQMMAQVEIQLYQNLQSFEEVFVLRKNDLRVIQGEEYANVGDSLSTH